MDAFDATEAYEGGRGHALWQLHEINRPDKHHLLMAVGSSHVGVDLSGLANAFGRKFFESLGVTEFPQFSSLIARPADPLARLEVGHVLLTEPIPEMDYDPRFAFQISFDVPEVVDVEPAVVTLKKLCDAVRGTVDAFEDFF